MFMHIILLETNQKMYSLNVLLDKTTKKLLETVLPRENMTLIYNELHVMNKKALVLNRKMDSKSESFLNKKVTRQFIFDETQELLSIQKQLDAIQKELLEFIHVQKL